MHKAVFSTFDFNIAQQNKMNNMLSLIDAHPLTHRLAAICHSRLGFIAWRRFAVRGSCLLCRAALTISAA